MEVRGSVFVRDVSDGPQSQSKKSLPRCRRLVYHNGILMMESLIKEGDNENQLPVQDGVPRIAVRGFKKGVKLWTVFSLFNKFGTVTYVCLYGPFVVVEFEDREVVKKVLAVKHLKHEVSDLKVEELLYFIHAETQQIEFVLEEEVESALKSTSCFSKYVDDLVQNARLQSNPEKEEMVCKALETILQCVYPDCKSYAFGSRISGTGLPHCDFDIFFDTGDMYDGLREQDSISQEALVTSSYKVLAKHKDFRHVEAVPKARTPILKLLHVPSSTRCDIAFRHGLGVENTKLFLFLMSLEPRLHPLCMFVKQWANLLGIRAVHKKGQFSSYALTMMVIHYLQQLPQPVLPPISMLQAKHTGPRHIIGGWDCTFTTDKSTIPATANVQTILELLQGFFSFYRTFDYDRFVICPLWGTKVEKASFEGSMTSLQPDMSRYLQLLDSGEAGKLFFKCPISILDPFDLSHNVTRSVRYEYLMKFISTCGLTHSLCVRLH